MKLTYGKAINEALMRGLANDEDVVLFGQDIQLDVYGYTGGLLDRYGDKRVVNIPLSEAAAVGTAIGAAMCGMKTVVDLTVANFLYVAMDQISNIAAKNAYMYDGQYQLPLTIMYSTFQNSDSAAQHSDRPHPLFMSIPGLKIVAPSSPEDAYDQLRAAIVDPNPVIFCTDRSLFYSEGEVDVESCGKLEGASVRQLGKDVTIVTVSGGVKPVLEALPVLAESGISAEVVDVRSLVPLDIETIAGSLRKTGRIVIVDTANRTCSAASEISSRLAEDAFHHLKAPIGIVSYDDVPVPFAKNLEREIMPTKDKVVEKVSAALSWDGA